MSFYRITNSVLILLTLLFVFSSANADVECNDNDPPTVHGNIVKGDYERLVSCLVKFTEQEPPEAKTTKINKDYSVSGPVGWVYFNSNGGDVNEAIKLGRFLRQGLAEVVVNEKCYSACFLAIAGAVKLYAGEPFGKIGIHRMFYDPETLKKTDILEYEAFYNKLKNGARQYLYDLDVPTPIVEKMFSISSREMYILSPREITMLENHPAYEEWMDARCHDPLTEKERSDYVNYVSSGFKKGNSNGYINFLEERANKHEECIRNIRWKQFKKVTLDHVEKIRMKNH